MSIDFDSLATAAHDGRNKLGEAAFVRAASEIDAWYFVGVAPPEAPDEPEPLVAAIANEPHLLVFTEHARAESFATRRAGQRGGEAIVLEMTPAEALGYAEMMLEHGVTGLHFNDGDHAVGVPIRRALDIAQG